MKTAYFIMLHHKTYQFCWLFEALYRTDDLYVIHVDRKSSNRIYEEVKSCAGSAPNVTIMPRRTIAYRGWSQVAVELDAIRIMLETNPDWKYFVNLSGQDYPIKPLSTIKDEMRREWPKNFIRAWPLTIIENLEPRDPHLKKFFAFEAFGRLIRTRIPLPSPKDINIDFKGSNFHFLTREFCQWLVASPMTERITRYIRHVPTSDEVFFQALIMNSPFSDCRTADYVPFQIWPGVKILGIEDHQDILRSNNLFARKFDQCVDREILVSLAHDFGYKSPAEQTTSTLLDTGAASLEATSPVLPGRGTH